MSSSENALQLPLPRDLVPLPQLRPLSPSERGDLVALIEGDALFTPEEKSVAVELVDDALADPGGEYHVLLAHSGAQLLGYVCYGTTPMTDGTWDLFWIVTH